MAMDSIYRISDNKKVAEVKKEADYKKISSDLKNIVQDLPSLDIDQKWVKEHEAKENNFATPTPKTEDEQAIDDILARFKRIKESNNSMRSQMRKQQLSPLQQLKDIQQWADNMSGGKSR